MNINTFGGARVHTACVRRAAGLSSCSAMVKKGGGTFPKTDEDYMRLFERMLALQDKLNKTIVFVSHDLDEAIKLGDRIAIMEGGRIVQSGAPQDIFTDPRNDYVAEFVQHMNPLGVLRARDLMKPLTSEPAETIDADSLVRDGFDTLLASDRPIGVTEHGALIGQLGKDDVLRGLSATDHG